MSQLDRHLTTEQLSTLLDQAFSSSEETAVAALDSTELGELQVHLEACEQCQQELAELRQTITLLRAMPQPQLPRSFALPPDLTEPVAINQPVALNVHRRKQKQAVTTRLMLRTASGLAAVIGILCVLSALFNIVPFLSSASNGNGGLIATGQPSGIEKNGSLVTPNTVNTNDPQSTRRGDAAQQSPTSAATQPTQTPKLTPSTQPAIQPQSSASHPINAILNVLSFILRPEGRMGTGILLFLIGACGFAYFKQHTQVAEGP